MDQVGDKWHEWRNQGIGSSDAPVIIGNSPYSTPLKLWEQKMGIGAKTEENPAMHLGKIFEERARARFELEYGYSAPAECVEHSQCAWIRSSLDGFNKEHRVFVEMKYMGKKNFDLCVQNQTCLDHHHPQVQHQYMTVGQDFTCIYVPYTLTEDKKKIDEIAFIPIGCDTQFIEQSLFPKESEFFERMQSGNAPPATDKDILVVNDESYNELSSRYAEIDQKIKLMEVEKETIKLKFEDLLTKRSIVKCGILHISRTLRRGTIDYKKIPELRDVNLELYRGKISVSTRFTIEKPAKLDN